MLFLPIIYVETLVKGEDLANTEKRRNTHIEDINGASQRLLKDKERGTMSHVTNFQHL